MRERERERPFKSVSVIPDFILSLQPLQLDEEQLRILFHRMNEMLSIKLTPQAEEQLFHDPLSFVRIFVLMNC